MLTNNKEILHQNHNEKENTSNGHNFELIILNTEKELINLLESEKIDSTKFKKTPTTLFKEVQNDDCKLFRDLNLKTVLRVVSVVQLLLIDEDTEFFLVEE